MLHRMSTLDTHMLGTLLAGERDSKPGLVIMTLRADIGKWHWDQNISRCCWDMGNLTVCYRRCPNYVDKQGLMSTYYHMLCLSPLVCFSKTNKESFWFSLREVVFKLVGRPVGKTANSIPPPWSYADTQMWTIFAWPLLCNNRGPL